MSQSVEKFQNSQWKKLEKLNFSKNAILDILHDGSVLDIGCGDGLLMEYLKKRGLECAGVDISSQAISICAGRGLDCRQADITERLPFNNSSFDNVLLIDVLEHIFQPGEVLKEAYRVSRKFVFISVPNFVSLPARFQVFLGRVPENNTARDGHVYWMTWRVILDLLTETGFKVVETQPNTFWEDVPIVCVVTTFLKRKWPSLFAPHQYVVAINDPSFVYPAKKLKEWVADDHYKELLVITGQRLQ